MNSNDPAESSFSGTNAVVTGASSGIGRAIAIELARRGVAHLVVQYRRNRDGAVETARMVTDFGCQASVTAADLGSSEDIANLVQSSWDKMGTVDMWVNNAGMDVLTGAAAKLSFEDKLRQLIEIDVVGTIALSREVALQMGSQTSSHLPSITFIGWDQAPHGMEGDAGQMFGPVKAAVMSYAKNLAQSLAPTVRVNTVAPGWIKTAWGTSASDDWNQRAKSQALMQRWGRPEDVAAAVAFAADPGNTFMTGQTIAVNGGWNRRFQSGQ